MAVAPNLVARVPIGTAAGEFDVHAFECGSGHVYLAMVNGDLGDGTSVLARVHSECLTGDALGSLRCDCGIQLRTALRLIAGEGRGVLLYATGHEGRGIGLVNKLRAYVEQDRGADTVEANRRLGYPVDARDYAEAAACLRLLGVCSVRLLTNNPGKPAALRAAGLEVEGVVPLPTVPHVRNAGYLRTKERRLAHMAPGGEPLPDSIGPVMDVAPLLGPVRVPAERPYVILKFAQTLDGRIATRTGDSRWISGEAERRMSHALRAACDAVLVGIGTVLADDPSLTVRMVPGSSPLRVVLDRRLRTPLDANVLADDAVTLLVTGPDSDLERRTELRSTGAGIVQVGTGDGGLDLVEALAALRARGVRTLLVEGGGAVITSFLRVGLADRLVVSLAPTIVGTGIAAVGDLDVRVMADALHLAASSVHRVGDDVVIAGTPVRAVADLSQRDGAAELSVA